MHVNDNERPRICGPSEKLFSEELSVEDSERNAEVNFGISERHRQQNIKP